MREKKGVLAVSKFALNPEAPLFVKLIDQSPQWWNNLISDQEIYVDIRKDNYINAYYKGGSIIRLFYSKGFKGEISSEYIPLKGSKNVINFHFSPNSVEINRNQIDIAEIGAFSKDWIKKAKKRIGLFNSPESEKAIQADYVISNSNFIDSEFQVSKNARIDLVWLEINEKEKRLYFIELKTIGDNRIYFDEEVKINEDKIHDQMKKYQEFLTKHSKEILKHYKTLVQIKKEINLLRKSITDDLSDLQIETKPILLIGDCTKKWIKDNSESINEKIKDFAYGAVYHGRQTNSFSIPTKNQKNEFIFST